MPSAIDMNDLACDVSGTCQQEQQCFFDFARLTPAVSWYVFYYLFTR
jgi:hypothetical protein